MTKAKFDSSIKNWIEWSETIDALKVDTPPAVKFHHPTNQSLVSLAKLAECLSNPKDKPKARALLKEVFNRLKSISQNEIGFLFFSRKRTATTPAQRMYMDSFVNAPPITSSKTRGISPH